MAVGIIPFTVNDEALLTKAAAGEREALEELFGRYRLVAYRVAHRLLGNEADALDNLLGCFGHGFLWQCDG